MMLHSLRAGALEASFDSENGMLRWVRIGRIEVVRGIYGAVRDHDWGTVTPRLENLVIDQTEAGFSIRFSAACREGEIDFPWNGEISGSATKNTIRFVFDGVAATSFLKNRIGLCVLHPIAECAGLACSVEHVDGSMGDGVFPRFISPHQPFRDIRAISHEVRPGLTATVRMEGEVFEMEDQRNWTDASFKTYGTPLAEPFPVRIEAGHRVTQVVTISFEGTVRPKPNVGSAAPSRLKVGWDEPRRRPPVGLGMATHGIWLGEMAAAALRDLAPDHLRVDLRPDDESWRDLLEAAVATGLPLHLALILSGEDGGEARLEEVIEAVEGCRDRIRLWFVFQEAEKVTPTQRVGHLQTRLQAASHAAPVAAGTNAYFAELNRNRPPRDSIAIPCFSINPQVHAFDDASLVETLEAQPDTVESIRQFSSRPVAISPITLRPRFNPNATGSTADSGEPETDPRQSTDFAAAWTVGSLGRLLTVRQVHSLTYFETHGPRGVMSDSGNLYPVANVFAALRGFDFVCLSISTRPLDFQALALRSERGTHRLLIAGFSDTPETVTVNPPGQTNEITVEVPARGFAVLDFPASNSELNPE